MQTPTKLIPKETKTKIYSYTPKPYILKSSKKKEVENDDNIFATIYDSDMKSLYNYSSKKAIH